MLVWTAVVQPPLLWGGIGFGAGQNMAPGEVLEEARASDAAPGIILAGYVREDPEPRQGAPEVPVEWVPLSGGRFQMGTDNGRRDAAPVHEVLLPSFEMSKSAVTVEQYAECVFAGMCSKPWKKNGRSGNCNWYIIDRLRHPVNCVSWRQASEYATFKGARLPSESEWEYAATGGGRNQMYPWGNEAPSCERTVMHGDGGEGCGNWSTLQVCSRPAGNTAQGLCDMSGNVWQWVRDSYRTSYAHTPTDGSAYESKFNFLRVIRGGSYNVSIAEYLRVDQRGNVIADTSTSGIGFRIARPAR